MWPFRKFPVFLVTVETSGRTDIWRWDGKTQTLLYRDGVEPDAQPELGSESCEMRGRKFYLEAGATEVRMEPEGDGRLILPKR